MYKRIVMKKTISIRGRAASKMIRDITRLPVIGRRLQDGTLRRYLQKKEKRWKCPEHMTLEKICHKQLVMEYLHAKQNNKHKYVILQLHGGGYYNGMRNKYREFAALYYEVSGGMAVLTPDYRLAPKHPYPAALQDGIKAYLWLLRQGYQGKQVIFAGDSAGGGLALAMVYYLKKRRMPMPGAVITMSAWTDLTLSGRSYRDNWKVDSLFGRRKNTLLYQSYYYQNHSPKNPYISPLFADMHGFPPMLMQVGEKEMLLSDTVSVAKKARKQGVSVKLQVYPGMFHVFQMGELWYPEAKRAWVEAGRFLRRISNV